MRLQKLYQPYSGSVGAFTPPLKYSYDAAHYNCLYRSELYDYDNLGQIKMLRRGALNADDAVIATYEYNGLNQRIKKSVGAIVTKSFYSENWQEVESVTGNQMTSYVQKY